MRLLPVDGSPLSPWTFIPSAASVKVNFSRPSESLQNSPQTSPAIEKDGAVKEEPPSEPQSAAGCRIERFVREMARERGVDLNEEGLLEVIRDLQDEYNSKPLSG
jgi:hypothetical protein